MNRFFRISLFVFILFTCFESMGMEFTNRKVRLWKRGEELGGEEFLAASEEVVDYLAKLDRPTETFKSYVYQCQIKSREIAPTVQTMGAAPSNTNYVRVQMVYAIKDCAQTN